MKRRTILRGLAGVAALGSAGAAINRISGARAGASGLSVTVLLDEPIGTIRPAIYSQFAEHIGGVIYDGIWVGTDSKVPNIGGIRKALVEHVKRLGKVVVRWPGGCFADRYHWRDGIGPVATIANAELIGDVLGAGQKSTYTFLYVSCPAAPGPNTGAMANGACAFVSFYQVSANPPAGIGAGNFYYTDPSGVIRQNSTTAAGPADSPSPA